MFKKILIKLFDNNFLGCYILGHKYEFDVWQIYFKGHRRCQRCGNWED